MSDEVARVVYELARIEEPMAKNAELQTRLKDREIADLREALRCARALAIEWGAGMDRREASAVLDTIRRIADEALGG